MCDYDFVSPTTSQQSGRALAVLRPQVTLADGPVAGAARQPRTTVRRRPVVATLVPRRTRPPPTGTGSAISETGSAVAGARSLSSVPCAAKPATPVTERTTN